MPFSCFPREKMWTQIPECMAVTRNIFRVVFYSLHSFPLSVFFSLLLCCKPAPLNPARVSEACSQRGPGQSPPANTFLVYSEPRNASNGGKLCSISAEINLKQMWLFLNTHCLLPGIHHEMYVITFFVKFYFWPCFHTQNISIVMASPKRHVWLFF